MVTEHDPDPHEVSVCALSLSSIQLFATPGMDKDSACVCAQLLQLCPIVCNPIGYSSPGSSVHGIFQVRILEQIAISFSKGSSLPRKLNSHPHCSQILYHLTHQGSSEANATENKHREAKVPNLSVSLLYLRGSQSYVELWLLKNHLCQLNGFFL